MRTLTCRPRPEKQPPQATCRKEFLCRKRVPHIRLCLKCSLGEHLDIRDCLSNRRQVCAVHVSNERRSKCLHVRTICAVLHVICTARLYTSILCVVTQHVNVHGDLSVRPLVLLAFTSLPYLARMSSLKCISVEFAFDLTVSGMTLVRSDSCGQCTLTQCFALAYLVNHTC